MADEKSAPELCEALFKEIDYAEGLAGKTLDELRVTAGNLRVQAEVLAERAAEGAREVENATKLLGDTRSNLNTVVEERRGQHELIKLLRATCSQLALGQSGAVHSEFVAAINRADEAERQHDVTRTLLENARVELHALKAKPSAALACVICERPFFAGELNGVCQRCYNDVAEFRKVRQRLGLPLNPVVKITADEVERAWIARSPPPATGLVPGWSLVACSLPGCDNKVAVKRGEPVSAGTLFCTTHQAAMQTTQETHLPPTLPGPQAVLASWLSDLSAAVQHLASQAHGETVGHRTRTQDAADFLQRVVTIRKKYQG